MSELTTNFRLPKVKKSKAGNKENFEPKGLAYADCVECCSSYQSDTDENKVNWIPCEQCDRWCCPPCLPKGFRVSDEYVCKICN